MTYPLPTNIDATDHAGLDIDDHEAFHDTVQLIICATALGLLKVVFPPPQEPSTWTPVATLPTTRTQGQALSPLAGYSLILQYT